MTLLDILNTYENTKKDRTRIYESTETPPYIHGIQNGFISYLDIQGSEIRNYYHRNILAWSLMDHDEYAGTVDAGSGISSWPLSKNEGKVLVLLLEKSK